MTNLSPEAQAVWDAFNDVSERVGVFEDYGDALAAALRVLVIQLQYDQSCWDEPVEHIVLDARAILDVADELEAQGLPKVPPDAL
jgi:hypothetical protein